MGRYWTSAIAIKRNWDVDVNAAFEDLDEALQSVQASLSNHSHTEGEVSISYADTDATLGTGGDVWELRYCKDTGNRYIWDPDSDEWIIPCGNIYSSAPSLTGKTIATGTTAVIAGELQRYNGSGWEDVVDEQTWEDGHIEGLVISPDTDADHDVNITAGTCIDDANGTNITLGTEITKQIDATHAVGDDAGGLDTGTPAADTIYHVFLIYNPTTENTDALLSASYSSPTMPSGYTKKRWLGWVLTDGSANIIDFKVLGTGKLVTYHQQARLLVASGLTSTSYTTQSLTGVLPTATGHIEEVLFGATATSSTSYAYISDDGTNMKTMFAGAHVTNSIGSQNELYYALYGHPEYVPLSGDNIYYKVNAYTLNLYLRAARFSR